MTHSADTDLFENPASPARPDLSAFLPLRVAQSLIGHTHIADRSGATFLDRAYQLRGFQLRQDFKDEWEGLAPQIVERINGFDGLAGAAREALGALREISGSKLPPPAKKALGRALMVLAEATKGR